MNNEEKFNNFRDDFQRQVDAEIKAFNDEVNNITVSLENSLRGQINSHSYRDYIEYVTDMVEKNKGKDGDDFEQLLSEEEWRKQKEGK